MIAVLERRDVPAVRSIGHKPVPIRLSAFWPLMYKGNGDPCISTNEIALSNLWLN